MNPDFLTSDFSAEFDFTQTTNITRIQIPNTIDAYIKIINKNYNIQPTDNYIVINSVNPIIIKLYLLPYENIKYEKQYTTQLLHIKSLVTSGSHKILVEPENNINEIQPYYELSSNESVTLIPLGNTWYSF